jgi:hypothetical protein
MDTDLNSTWPPMDLTEKEKGWDFSFLSIVQYLFINILLFFNFGNWKFDTWGFVGW